MNDIQGEPLRNNGFTRDVTSIKTDVLLSNKNIFIVQHNSDLNIFVVHFIAYDPIFYINNKFSWPLS